MTSIPPPPNVERLKASVKPKRAWSKPTLRRMRYVDVVKGGSHYLDHQENANYSPTTS